MRPVSLGTPERDLGWAEIRPLAGNLIQELERQAKKIQELERQAGRRESPPAGLAEARRLLSRLSLRTGDTVTLERQRVLHRAIDEVYFWVEIEPGAGALLGTSTVDATSFTFEDFPAAATTARRRTRRLLGLWPKTRVRLHLWYTSPVASTNLFTVGFSVRQVGVGTVLTASTLSATATATPPGPGVINDILYTTLTATGDFRPALPVCLFTVFRQPDANANAFRFILAAFELEEVA